MIWRFFTVALSDAKRASNQRYLKEKLDHISFRVPKGKRELIQEHAKARGESLNAFVSRAVDEAMVNDAKNQSHQTR